MRTLLSATRTFLNKIAAIALLYFLLPATACTQQTVKPGQPATTVESKNDTVKLPEPDNCAAFRSAHPKAPVTLKAEGWVNDYEKIFTPSQAIWLDSVFNQFEKESSFEIALVTIDSAWTSKEQFDSFVNDLMECWGVGKKEKQNGMLIGISTSLRRVRISNGIGTRKQLSDETTKAIIDNVMIPEFKNAAYFRGTEKAVAEIIKGLRGK